MLIGIELDLARVVAVAVTDAGAVQARARVDVTAGIDAAVRSALSKLPSSRDGAAIGVAASMPDAPEVASAIAATRGHASAAKGTAIATISSGTAAAFGESWIGAAKGTGHVVYFGVGDRTSGGVVRAGAPVLGARGRAGSVAWMSLNPVEREDYRKVGCLEAEVAAMGIVRRLIWRIKSGDRSRVQDAVNDDLSAITVHHVLDAARDGDGVSISVMRDTAKYLGMAAANLATMADPETLVLGGLMASAADLLLDPVRVEISRRMPRPMLDGLTIVPAALGDEAAAIGAARFGASPGARP